MSKRLAMVAAVLGVCLVAGVASATVVQLTPEGATCSIIGNSNLWNGNPGVGPHQAIDGNTGTPDFSTDSNNSHLFITLDLGQPYILDHVEMWFYTPNGPGYATITVGDNLRLTDVGDQGSGLRVKGTPGSVDETMFIGVPAGMQTFTNVTSAIPAEFVDIWTGVGGYTGGFYEIKLYGSLPEAVPEPGTMLLVGTGVVGVFGYARRRMMK